VRATEDVTHLCPTSVCGDQLSVNPTGLLSDTAIVFGHAILPAGLESEWLPSTEGQWSDFGNEPAPVKPSTGSAPNAADYIAALRKQRALRRAGASSGRLFNAFVGSIHGPVRPALWYGTFTFHRAYGACPAALYVILRLARPAQQADHRGSSAFW
jgi:hypothetical protein